VILNGYDKFVALLASSVDLKWVLISPASHRLSNNLDNGDDDLRFSCVKESCKAAGSIGNQERVRHSSLWLFKAPAKKRGHLSLSVEPSERRGAI
jgi:hypothetical protein